MQLIATFWQHWSQCHMQPFLICYIQTYSTSLFASVRHIFESVRHLRQFPPRSLFRRIISLHILCSIPPQMLLIIAPWPLNRSQHTLENMVTFQQQFVFQRMQMFIIQTEPVIMNHSCHSHDDVYVHFLLHEGDSGATFDTVPWMEQLIL